MDKKCNTISILMLFGPVHYVVIDKSLAFEQVLEQPFDPNVIRLFLELERLYIVEVLLKLLC